MSEQAQYLTYVLISFSSYPLMHLTMPFIRAFCNKGAHSQPLRIRKVTGVEMVAVLDLYKIMRH